MYLPKEVTIFINSRRKALRYGLTIIAMYSVCSFAFGGYFPYGTFIGIATIIIGILFIVFMAKRDQPTKSTLMLSEEGIREFKNGKETFISWTEPHQTYYDATTFTKLGVPLATISQTQVVAPNKRIIVNYPNQEFQNTLIESSTKHLWPQLNVKHQGGQKLYFGPVELRQETILIGKKEYSLNEISSVGIENGCLKLKLKSQWLSTKLVLRDIPDFLCLISILEVHMQTNRN